LNSVKQCYISKIKSSRVSVCGLIDGLFYYLSNLFFFVHFQHIDPNIGWFNFIFIYGKIRWKNYGPHIFILLIGFLSLLLLQPYTSNHTLSYTICSLLYPLFSLHQAETTFFFIHRQLFLQHHCSPLTNRYHLHSVDRQAIIFLCKICHLRDQISSRYLLILPSISSIKPTQKYYYRTTFFRQTAFSLNVSIKTQQIKWWSEQLFCKHRARN
jgi:hypothetical protein